MLTLQPQAPVAQSSKWKPGQSGNPRGHRKAYDGPSVAELARMYTRDAIHALVLATKHPSTRVPAAVALLDRGWGKPDINVHTKNETTVLHLLAAQAISEELQAMQQPPVIEHAAEQAGDVPTE